MRKPFLLIVFACLFLSIFGITGCAHVYYRYATEPEQLTLLRWKILCDLHQPNPLEEYIPRGLPRGYERINGKPADSFLVLSISGIEDTGQIKASLFTVDSVYLFLEPDMTPIRLDIDTTYLDLTHYYPTNIKVPKQAIVFKPIDIKGRIPGGARLRFNFIANAGRGDWTRDTVAVDLTGKLYSWKLGFLWRSTFY